MGDRTADSLREPGVRAVSFDPFIERVGIGHGRNISDGNGSVQWKRFPAEIILIDGMGFLWEASFQGEGLSPYRDSWLWPPDGRLPSLTFFLIQEGAPATVSPAIRWGSVATKGGRKMHTKDILAGELRKAGLPEMAAKAAEGYYHHFLSPLATPCLQLAADLAGVGSPAAIALRNRHFNGEFDATKEESDDWAASPDGRDTFGRLISEREPRP